MMSHKADLSEINICDSTKKICRRHLFIKLVLLYGISTKFLIQKNSRVKGENVTGWKTLGILRFSITTSVNQTQMSTQWGGGGWRGRGEQTLVKQRKKKNFEICIPFHSKRENCFKTYENEKELTTA